VRRRDDVVVVVVRERAPGRGVLPGDPS